MGSICPSCYQQEEQELEYLRLLGKVCDAYEDTQVIAILSPEGSVMVDFWIDGSATKSQKRVVDNEGKSGVYWTLKKSAEQFGALMNCEYAPIVHIRGQRYLVSCFHLKTHLMTMISSPNKPNEFNTTEADKKIKPVILQLEKLLLGKTNQSRITLRSRASNSNLTR